MASLLAHLPGWPTDRNHSSSRLTSLLLLALLSITNVTAHMQITYPPPLRSKLNPHTDPENIDYSITEPLTYDNDPTNNNTQAEEDSGPFPCKGYLNLLSTPQGKSVDTWSPGNNYTLNFAGKTTHKGGSCQVSLSVDGGTTFRVLRSFIGGCPDADAHSWDLEFMVPRDTPDTRQAVLAWTWFNLMGNREMYMNCAVVDIVSESGHGHDGHENGYAHHGYKRDGQGGDYADKEMNMERHGQGFKDRPEVFAANIGRDCTVVEGVDLEFPDPGPDVLRVVGDKGTHAPVGHGCVRPPSHPASGGGSGGYEKHVEGEGAHRHQDTPPSYHPNTSPDNGCD